MRRPLVLLLLLTLYAVLPAPLSAQFIDDKPETPKTGTESLLRNPRTMRLEVGLVFKANGGTARGIYGTTPVPLEWEEQKVKIINEERSPEVKPITYRTVGATTKQMVVTIPTVAARSIARAVVTFELTRYEIVPPQDTTQFRIPDKEKLERAIRPYLGSSPFIETRNLKIIDLAKKIFAEKKDATDWQKVEAIYDTVREKVKYKNGPLKGALAALNDGTGDCEELSSLFIALCRVNGIPARTVWVPEHCYPEFYLVDKEGKGHWFPCQAAGDRAFGGMPDVRPILQKGDNFNVPDSNKPQRYVAEFLKAKVDNGQKPGVEWIRRVVSSTAPVPTGTPGAF